MSTASGLTLYEYENDMGFYISRVATFSRLFNLTSAWLDDTCVNSWVFVRCAKNIFYIRIVLSYCPRINTALYVWYFNGLSNKYIFQLIEKHYLYKEALTKMYEWCFLAVTVHWLYCFKGLYVCLKNLEHISDFFPNVPLYFLQDL